MDSAGPANGFFVAFNLFISLIFTVLLNGPDLILISPSSIYNQFQTTTIKADKLLADL